MALWPLYRAPSPWPASSPASVWSTSALNQAPRSLPVRRPTRDLAPSPSAWWCCVDHTRPNPAPTLNSSIKTYNSEVVTPSLDFCTHHEAERIHLLWFFPFSSPYPLESSLTLCHNHFVLFVNPFIQFLCKLLSDPFQRIHLFPWIPFCSLFEYQYTPDGVVCVFVQPWPFLKCYFLFKM